MRLPSMPSYSMSTPTGIDDVASSRTWSDYSSGSGVVIGLGVVSGADIVAGLCSVTWWNLAFRP